MSTSAPRYGTVDRAYGRRLATTPPDEDGPVWMINLMRYREVADYAGGDGPAISGRAADDLYAPLGPLAAVGAEVVFLADVEQQLIGSPSWDRIGVVRYPTRRAFIDMQSRPDFVEKHAHKDAGMAETIVIGAQPMVIPSLPADAPEWSQVPHPPTELDGPVVVMHVIRFAERHDAIADMTEYQQIAGSVAVPHGVRIHGWFAAEGTIVGDGRTWDQVRFNGFPSKAAFMAVALDPERLRAQGSHREVAIADTYSMILRAQINRLDGSIG